MNWGFDYFFAFEKEENLVSWKLLALSTEKESWHVYDTSWYFAKERIQPVDMFMTFTQTSRNCFPIEIDRCAMVKIRGICMNISQKRSKQLFPGRSRWYSPVFTAYCGCLRNPKNSYFFPNGGLSIPWFWKRVSICFNRRRWCKISQPSTGVPRLTLACWNHRIAQMGWPLS